MRAADAVMLLAAAVPATIAGAAPVLTAGNPAHLRVLPLEGGRNFRDLGGYRTADGKAVRWGLLYRSGAMAGLTARDYATLDGLGIASVCDFRTAAERQAEPTVWGGAHKPDYWTSDAAATQGDLAALFAPAGGGAPSPASVRAAMAGLYAKLPEAQAPGYREMFRRLVAGAVPLAFNCTAGKDRTGLAAALILTALGVPRATVREDYALTDQVVDYRAAVRGGGALGALSRLPPEVVAPVLRADPAYLDAAFRAIDARYGSVEGYLRTRLGVGPAELKTLRRRYLA